MITTSKLDQSRGQQVTSQIQFTDYVLINTKERQFKVCVNDTGVSFLMQDSKKTWIDASPIHCLSEQWLNTTKQLEQSRKECQEHTDKLVLQAKQMKDLQTSISDIQQQNKQLIEQLGSLQLQMRIVSANYVDLSNCLQLYSNNQILVDEPKVSIVKEEPELISQEVQIDTCNTIHTLDDNNSKQLSEKTEVLPLQETIEQKQSVIIVNKTFQLKILPNDTVVVSTKEQFQWERCPKVISCRHIRQFFDLPVLQQENDGSLILQMDPKLKNKQTLFIIQAH